MRLTSTMFLGIIVVLIPVALAATDDTKSPPPARGKQTGENKTPPGLLAELDTRFSHRLLAISPDGKVLATYRHPGRFRLLDAGSGKELTSLEGCNGPAAFSPDGRLLARPYEAEKGKWYAVRLYDIKKGADLIELDRWLDRHTNTIDALAFSADGKLLFTGCNDHKLRVFDVATGRHLRTLRSTDPDRYLAVAFSPDGKLVAVAMPGNRFGGSVHVLDTAKGRKRLALTNFVRNFVTALAFSPDGKRLATACYDRTINVWEVATGKEIRRHRPRSGHFSGIAFSPDGRVLAAAMTGRSLDEKDAAVHLWDVATGKALPPLPTLGSQANALCFSADGFTLAVGLTDGRILVWDFATRIKALAPPPEKSRD